MQKKKFDPKKKKTTEEDANEKTKRGIDPYQQWRKEMEKNNELLITKKIDVISTGSFVLNRIIGDGSLNNQPGGLPRGAITEIFGDESTGKTTLALLAAKNVIQGGERVAWFDWEHNLRLQNQAYIENLGLDLKSPNFLAVVPMNFEDGVKRIGESLVHFKPALIVIDSVTAMLPKVAAEGEAGLDIQIGKHAKLTSTFLNWISKRLQSPKHNTALLLLNQTRVDITTTQAAKRFHGGPKEVSSGGKAPKFFAAVRIQLKQTSLREKVTEVSSITGLSEDKMVNQMVKATCIKNKFDVPYKSGPIYFAYGKGVDNIMSLVLLGENTKTFKIVKPWMSWDDPKGQHSMPKLQGRMAVVKYLEEHPEVLDAMTPYLVPSANMEVLSERKKELEAIPEADLSEEDKSELQRLKSQLDRQASQKEVTGGDVEVDLSDEEKDLKELDTMIAGEDPVVEKEE